MTESAFAPLLLALFAALTAANIWAAVAKRRATKGDAPSLSKTARQSVDMRRFEELALQVTELSDAHDALFKSHTKLRSRIGMRENRDKTSDDSSELSGDDWKAKTRRQLGAVLLVPGAANKRG